MNKLLYFVLTGLGVTAILLLSPTMEHKAEHVTSLSQHHNGRVEVAITASGSYPTHNGKAHLIYGISTTGETISILIDKDTSTDVPLQAMQAERSFVATGDIIDKGLLKADELHATKTIPTPHETMTLALDTYPTMQSHKGHQYRYTAQLNGKQITLVSTLNDPSKEVTGFWQPDRRNTFVIIG